MLLVSSSVLIIDNHDSFTYNVVQLIRESRLCRFEVARNTDLTDDAADGFTHILLSPGPGLPSETDNLFKIIDTYHKTHSILGICLGHQAIAEYFGAKLLRLDKPVHGEGTDISLDVTEPLFSGLPGKINAGRYHSWIVEKESIPENLKTIAITDDNIIMGISHKEYNIKGLQFHPESVITDYGSIIIRNWLSM